MYNDESDRGILIDTAYAKEELVKLRDTIVAKRADVKQKEDAAARAQADLKKRVDDMVADYIDQLTFFFQETVGNPYARITYGYRDPNGSTYDVSFQQDGGDYFFTITEDRRKDATASFRVHKDENGKICFPDSKLAELLMGPGSISVKRALRSFTEYGQGVFLAKIYEDEFERLQRQETDLEDKVRAIHTTSKFLFGDDLSACKEEHGERI